MGLDGVCRMFGSRNQQARIWLYPWSGPSRDHGPNPPLSAVNPKNKGFSVSGTSFLDLVSQMPRPRGRGRTLLAEEISTNCFCAKFFENPSGHGHPHQRSWKFAIKNLFSCGPGDGEKLCDPQASGCEGLGLDVHGNIQPNTFEFVLLFLPRYIQVLCQQTAALCWSCSTSSVLM